MPPERAYSRLHVQRMIESAGVPTFKEAGSGLGITGPYPFLFVVTRTKTRNFLMERVEEAIDDQPHDIMGMVIHVQYHLTPDRFRVYMGLSTASKLMGAYYESLMRGTEGERK